MNTKGFDLIAENQKAEKIWSKCGQKVHKANLKKANYNTKTKIILNDYNTFLTIPTQNNYKNESFNILLVFETWGCP